MATTNVSFLRGLHASLPTSGAIDGAFYLTTDSNRLYVGKSDGTLADLNKYINIVEKTSDISTATAQVGDFYYVKDQNLLVVCELDGSSKKFTLINQNTDTTNKSATATYTISAKSDVATIKYNYSVTDTEVNSVMAEDSFTITGGSNVNVSASGKNITIDGAEYALSIATNPSAAGNVSDVTLKLTNTLNPGATSSATFKAGENVTLSKDASGNITINSSYHDTLVKSVTPVLNENGTITVTVVDSENESYSGTTARAISYGVGTETFLPGSTLPVYNKTEIDNKFKGLNAMTYKGTVGAGGTVTSLPSSGVSAGDTYLVVGSNTITGSGNEGHAGDLFIATGTEGSDGFLTSITWTYVPSGDEAEHDTHYKFLIDAANNSIQLATTNDDVSGVHTLAVEEDGALAISSTSPADGQLTTTISHKKISTINPDEKTASDVTSITAITGVTVDAYGHVTGYETTTSSLADYELTGSNSVASNKATFTVNLNDSNDDAKGSVSHEISSTSLTIASTTNGASIDLTWGSF